MRLSLMYRLILVCSLLFPVMAQAELSISGAWIRDLPPTVPMRAGYLEIHNPESNPVTIVDVISEAFARVEIHESIEQNGSMRMQRVPRLTIAAGASVELAPGGLHLMMMQPASPLKPGAIVEITLKLDDGREQTLELIVRK